MFLSTDRKERSESKSVQKQRSDIALVQTEQARSISGLLYGFPRTQLTSAKVENVK